MLEDIKCGKFRYFDFIKTFLFFATTVENNELKKKDTTEKHGFGSVFEYFFLF
jgi:hypothetical protein